MRRHVARAGDEARGEKASLARKARELAAREGLVPARFAASWSWCPAARTRSRSSTSSPVLPAGRRSGLAPRPARQPSPARRRERRRRSPGGAGLRGAGREPQHRPPADRQGRGQRAGEGARSPPRGGLAGGRRAGLRPHRAGAHRRRPGGDHAVPAGPLRGDGRVQGHAALRPALGAAAAGVPARRDRRPTAGPEGSTSPRTGATPIPGMPAPPCASRCCRPGRRRCPGRWRRPPERRRWRPRWSGSPRACWPRRSAGWSWAAGRRRGGAMARRASGAAPGAAAVGTEPRSVVLSVTVLLALDSPLRRLLLHAGWRGARGRRPRAPPSWPSSPCCRPGVGGAGPRRRLAGREAVRRAVAGCKAGRRRARRRRRPVALTVPGARALGRRVGAGRAGRAVPRPGRRPRGVRRRRAAWPARSRCGAPGPGTGCGLSGPPARRKLQDILVDLRVPAAARAGHAAGGVRRAGHLGVWIGWSPRRVE